MKYNSESKTVAPRAQPLLNEGTRLLREGKVAEAIDSLERAREIDAASVPILLNLGGAYVMAGSHRKAIQPLEAARDVEPQNAMVWINLGAAYLGNPVLATPEQQLDAIRAFERALQLNPAAPSVHYNLGLIYVDRGQADLAAEAFQKAIEVNPRDRDARRWLDKVEAQGEKSTDE